MSDPANFEVLGIESQLKIPENKWKVSIPDQINGLVVYYPKLNFWQRLWMRFMGWKVEKVGE